MNKRTIFFITITLLIVLAFVQVTVVSAAEEDPPCVGEECEYVPPPEDPCENSEGCLPDPEPEPEPPSYCSEGECEEVPPPEDFCLGNPGNAKCVGKAGEKAEMGGFFAPSEASKEAYTDAWKYAGTHGRSDPEKHKEHPAQ